MLRIVADKDIPYIKGVLEPYADVVYLEGNLITRHELVGADALLVRTRTKCDKELLAGSGIKIISTATVGSDHIDTEYCREAKIAVFNAAGSNARAVLQWIAGALAFLHEADPYTPSEKTLGVVGTGNIGKLVVSYAESWGFEVICCDPILEEKGCAPVAGHKFHPLSEIAQKSDIITFHTPLTYSGKYPTYHMAGNSFFENLREKAIVINASRGEVIDTEALKKAVSTGKCQAIIDTWEHEPHIDVELLNMVLAGTTHIAGYSRQGKANASAMAVNAIAGFFGLPIMGWYPEEVEQVQPRKITWPEMIETVQTYFDLKKESRRLKSSPADFEKIRNSYVYRNDYF